MKKSNFVKLKWLCKYCILSCILKYVFPCWLGWASPSVQHCLYLNSTIYKVNSKCPKRAPTIQQYKMLKCCSIKEISICVTRFSGLNCLDTLITSFFTTIAQIAEILIDLDSAKSSWVLSGTVLSQAEYSYCLGQR